VKAGSCSFHLFSSQRVTAVDAGMDESLSVECKEDVDGKEDDRILRQKMLIFFFYDFIALTQCRFRYLRPRCLVARLWEYLCWLW